MIRGVDAASVAGNKRVDWKAAAKAFRFAIWRASCGIVADRQHRRELPRARAAGLVVGSYMLLTNPRKGRRAPSPTRQVAAFAAVAELAPGDFPAILDVEYPGGRKETGLSASALLERVEEAEGELVRIYGVAPIIYTSARVWHEDLMDIRSPELIDSPLWLARFPYKAGPARMNAKPLAPPVPSPWKGAWWIHQYQGNATGAPGFDGLVDLNLFHAYSALAPDPRRRAWVEARLGGKSIARYQQAKGLPVDGVVGPRTFAHLAWERPA